MWYILSKQNLQGKVEKMKINIIETNVTQGQSTLECYRMRQKIVTDTQFLSIWISYCIA